MTREEWLAQVQKYSNELRDFLADWHPKNIKPSKRANFSITAAAAEAACEQVRKKIQAEVQEDPCKLFDQALEKGDWLAITKLLNEAWFGVPESTECWNISGFGRAVDLLDDPPDPTEEELEQFAEEAGEE